MTSKEAYLIVDMLINAYTSNCRDPFLDNVDWSEISDILMEHLDEESTHCPYNYDIKCSNHCDTWECDYCCTLCQYEGREHCDDCNSDDI